MEAWLRGFNKREKKMIDRVGLPVSRGLLSPDVRLHMETTWNREAPTILRSLMSTSSLGYALRLCRMIMVPIAFDRDWCLYVFDKLLKRLSVLDSVFTEMAKEDYKAKHGVTIDYMLKGMKYVGEMLEDGWSMHIPKWSVKYNIKMHIACDRFQNKTFLYPFVQRGGCDYISWHDVPIKDPFLKQLVVDLRDRVWMLERMNGHLQSASRTSEEEFSNETRQLRDRIAAMDEGALAAERAASVVNTTKKMRTTLFILALAMILYPTAAR
ncbi:hypothetical protein D1007_32935 [Hordeum vulgare]|nr:hypothetical protein D1007_32935 [Hordeum vulgare]